MFVDVNFGNIHYGDNRSQVKIGCHLMKCKSTRWEGDFYSKPKFLVKLRASLSITLSKLLKIPVISLELLELREV